MVKKTNQPLTMRQLEHAVRRNFGGLDEVDAIGIFQQNIHIADVNLDVHDPKVANYISKVSCDTVEIAIFSYLVSCHCTIATVNSLKIQHL